MCNLEQADIYNETDLDKGLHTFYDQLNQAINTLKPPNRPKNTIQETWYNKELHKMKMRKEKLYRKYLITRSVRDKSNYNSAKKKYFYELRLRRNNYYKNLFFKFKNNMRAAWNTINKLLGKIKKIIVYFD